MKLEFKLRSLILLSVILSIFLSVVGITWIVYSRLHEAILLGFDQKLSAVCTVSSAFLDARTHERILAPRRIEALTVDPVDGTIYGADSSFGTAMLLKIDSETGGAEALAPLEQCPVSMTRGSRPGMAWGLLEHDEESVSIVEIDLKTGEFGDPKNLPPGSRTIAFHPSSGALFAGGKGLQRFEIDSIEGKLVEGTAAMVIDEMGFADDRNLVAFNKESLQLSRIDIETGKVSATRFMPLRKEYDSVLVGPALAMARHEKTGRLLAATDRLIRVDPDSLEWEDRNMVPGFRNEQAAIYRSYVEPMREIRDRMDLTFLYTQTLSSKGEVSFEGAKRARMKHENVNKIIYVLDSNQDDDHSEIGYFDEGNPASEPIRDVYFKGHLYLSPIQQWERWGLIKSGFAPIQEADGRIIGMAGADVSVQKIKEKTKFALLKVTLTGLGAILLASLISLMVSRKLTQPIEALKDVALRIAAGQFGEQIEETKLHELSLLSESFNTMSQKLQATVNGLEETNRDWELDRRYYELVRHVTLRNADLNQYHAWVELMTAGMPHLSPSGWTNHGPFVVGWIANDQGSPSENLRFRTGLAAFLYDMIESAELNRDEIKTHLRHFLGNADITLFLADLENLKIEFQAANDPVLWSIEPGEKPKTEAIVSGLADLEVGTQYVICNNRELASDLTRWFESRQNGDLIAYFQTRLQGADGSPCGVSLSQKPVKADPL